MELNEIKKTLYKQNPEAKIAFIRQGVAYYTGQLEDKRNLRFEIPVSDMGDADFEAIIPAKLLIRWLVI